MGFLPSSPAITAKPDNRKPKQTRGPHGTSSLDSGDPSLAKSQDARAHGTVPMRGLPDTPRSQWAAAVPLGPPGRLSRLRGVFEL